MEPKTHCKHGHLFSPDNTIFVVGRSGRICRECKRIQNLRHHEKHREILSQKNAAWKSKKRLAARMAKFKGKACPKCGGPMPTNKRIDIRYCSRKCGDAFTYRARSGQPTSDVFRKKNCKGCGVRFAVRYINQEYCSSSCYMKKYNREMVDSLHPTYVCAIMQTPVDSTPQPMIRLKQAILSIRRFLKQNKTHELSKNN